MFRTCTISNFDSQDLQPYRTMRRQMEHRRAGIFVAEGEKVVRRLLESHFEVISVLAPPNCVGELQGLLDGRKELIQVFVAEKKLLETLTGFSMYQGILAVGRVPPQRTLQQIITQSTKPRLLVAVEGLTNAENMGAVVRNCSAFNAQAVVVGETCSSAFLRRAVRSSMGTVFGLPVVETVSLTETLARLKNQGIRCVAAHPHADGRTITRADLTGDCCLIFGSEGYGLSPAVLELSDESAAIPMAPQVDSLNVANAAAVFLYEANRQRGRM